MDDFHLDLNKNMNIIYNPKVNLYQRLNKPDCRLRMQ